MVSSSAFKGPSHGEWEANREVITELYKTNTAANVRDIMLKRGFTATSVISLPTYNEVPSNLTIILQSQHVRHKVQKMGPIEIHEGV